MACGCNGNDNLMRALVNPITRLDKLENEIIQDLGCKLTVVDDYKQFAYLKGLASYGKPSQTVLAVMASGGETGLVSHYLLAGLAYPMIIESMATHMFPLQQWIVKKALKNELTEDELMDYFESTLEELDNQ